MKHSIFEKVVPVLLVAAVVAVIAWAYVQQAKFVAMTAAEHLKAAQADLFDQNWRDAEQHLDAIPANAPDRGTQAYIGLEHQIERERNASGSFRCGAQQSTGAEYMSLDDGKSWVPDDGRCADRLIKQRDADAQVHSYWSTSVRVDTDMNASWLNQEERICTSYPGEKDRVAVVKCDLNVERATHSIPVEFWGGVDRGHPSDWRCRREKGLLNDQFVCRAID
jgi:hypothetical protein